MEAKTNYSQVYILMIVLLILSQDDVNNDAIQKIVSVCNLYFFCLSQPLLDCAQHHLVYGTSVIKINLIRWISDTCPDPYITTELVTTKGHLLAYKLFSHPGKHVQYHVRYACLCCSTPCQLFWAPGKALHETCGKTIRRCICVRGSLGPVIRDYQLDPDTPFKTQFTAGICASTKARDICAVSITRAASRSCPKPGTGYQLLSCQSVGSQFEGTFVQRGFTADWTSVSNMVQ